MDTTPHASAQTDDRRHRLVGLLQIGLIIGVILVALAVNMLLSRSASGPGRVAQGGRDIVVEVVVPEVRTEPIIVDETGTVQVRAYVNLSPQVGGRVIEVAPDLAAGGTFESGDVLFRIDPSDYAFARERARADVLSAESTLELELAEAETARREWELVNPGEEIPPLVARTPQIRQARAALASARAALEAAETDLRRVDYSLPFDGRVVSTSVAEGQTLAANQNYGQVYRLSALEIAVPVSIETLALLDPVVGRAARVKIGNASDTVRGEVIRQEAELDAQTRFATLIVGFDEAPRLLPGAFGEVEIDGGVVRDAVVVPPVAVGNGGRVWVVEQGVLQERRPTIIWQNDTEVVVRAFDVADGVVTTPLAAPAAGFPVRVVGRREREASGRTDDAAPLSQGHDGE